MDPNLALPLIEKIYQAAVEPARWGDFVQALSQAFGGAAVGFAQQLPGFPLSGVFYASDGFDEAYLETFVTHVVKGLPWEEARRDHFVGRFGLATEVVSEEEIAASDFYREWLAPQGLSGQGALGHTITLEGGRPASSIAIFARTDGEPLGPTHRAFADLLVPHLALANRIHAESRRHHALSDAIDRFPTGVALINAQCFVVHANRTAEKLFGRDDGLTLKERRLHASDANEETTLRNLLEAAVDAAAGGSPSSTLVMAISRRSKGRSISLMAIPLQRGSVAPTLSDAIVAIYVADFSGGALRRSGVLRELYGLTEAETQLVELLCLGNTLEEAATTRGVTMNTARSQLKQVFAKTHTSRQSELIRLVLSGVASIGGP